MGSLTWRFSPACGAGAFSSNLASSWVAMTLTLLWFPMLAESIFFSDRTAGTDGLSSQTPLEASSYEEGLKETLKITNSAVGGIK